MRKYLIIRGVMNSGKTTTAGLVFEKLAEEASFKKLFTLGFEELNALAYNDDGSLRDFIAILLLDEILVIIISAGDIAEDLARILDKLDDPIFLKHLIGEIQYTSIVLVCCARKYDREGSAYRMLSERIESSNRKEFPITKNDSVDKWTNKGAVVEAIIDAIKTTHPADEVFEQS